MGLREKTFRYPRVLYIEDKLHWWGLSPHFNLSLIYNGVEIPNSTVESFNFKIQLSRTSLLQGGNRDRKSNTIKSPPPPRNTRHLQNMRRSVFPFITDKEMDESVVNINEISVPHNSNIDVRFI